ncbi:MAG: hypothetical protein V4726_19835 [Verrucomicrobiota bacterium]
MPLPAPRPSGFDHPASLMAALFFIGGLMFFVQRSYHPAPPPSEEVVAPWTTAAFREAKRRATRSQVIAENQNLPLTPANDSRWKSFLSAVKWNADRRPEVRAALARRLDFLKAPDQAPPPSTEVLRLAMETAFGLFPTQLEPEMRRIFERDTDPRRLAMAGAWLARLDGSPAHRHLLEETITGRMPGWGNEPRLLALVTELRSPRAAIIQERPPLEDILTAPFDGRPVIFSLQRLDRRFLGRAVVRSAEGSFLVEPDGTPFSVTQFALSASGLPGTLTNGNTPSGIFEIEEISRTKNTAIGPSETIILGLPLEYDKSWTESRYDALLPASWKSWWPIHEAWWAGQARRTEILAHGTAIDPTPWMDTVFAGQTPSHGCLTCDETWDPATGRRLTSEQARLVAALRKAGGAPAWLVVIELDNEARPVTPEDTARLLKNLRRQDFTSNPIAATPFP